MAKGNKSNTSFKRRGEATRGIQSIIAGSFTLIAGITIIFVAIILYIIFSNRAITSKTESAEQFLNQTKRSVEDYLRNNRRISDALYYTSIKNADIDEDYLDKDFNLIYESNKDNVVSISVFTLDGKSVYSVPIAESRSPEEIVGEPWFTKAVNEVENLHFSTPYVREGSDDSTELYRWVISLSRQVELNKNGVPRRGVLLIDFKYSAIEQMLEKVNRDNASEYTYLCDESGDIIYHPKQDLMNAGLYKEIDPDFLSKGDGIYETQSNGESFNIVVKTVSYTGWKLVSVISRSGYRLGFRRLQYLVILFIAITILGILLINRRVSKTVTDPLVRLDSSIRDLENGNLNPEIYVGGPTEVEHLGQTLKTSLQRIRQLMEEVIKEQEQKRINELDALQSQINPHFLYNTLDSVMWMIEDEQNDNAVYMVKELSNLLRISISKGRTIIPVRDEIAHARSYMNIQKIRYKTSCSFDIDPEILDCKTIKLVIQPLLENAIYHGVKGMDDEGEILVKGRRVGDEIHLDVIDNGYGMTREKVESLLSPGNSNAVATTETGKGNGVGLRNVDNRLKLTFGQEYGLWIESEPDEGTTMRIRLPYIKYTEEA